MEQGDQRQFRFNAIYEGLDDFSKLSIKLENFDFTGNAQDFLTQTGIIYVGELLQLSKYHLQHFAQLPPKIISEFEYVVSELNMRLGAMPYRWFLFLNDIHLQSKTEFASIIANNLDGCEIPINPILVFNVDLLKLSVRSANCLERAEIKVIGDLVRVNEDFLLRIPACGRNSLNEIKEKLASFGLHLAMNVSSWPVYIPMDKLETSFVEFATSPQIKAMESFTEEETNWPLNLDLVKGVEELNLSYRALNCLNKSSILKVGDLVKLTEGNLLKLKSLGKNSLDEIKFALAEIGLHLGMYVPDWPPENMAELEEQNKQRLTETPKECLFDVFMRSINSIQMDRNIEILKARLGLNEKPLTLEMLGQKLSITRERVRQIQKKAIQKIVLQETWDDVLSLKLIKLIENRTKPLFLQNLEIEDPWFKGFATNLPLLENIIDAFSNLNELHFIDIDSSRVICKISKDVWNELRQDTLNYLDQTVENGHTMDDIEMYVQSVLTEHGAEELSSSMFEILIRDLNFSLIGGEFLLTSVGNTMRSKLNTILQESETPLHYEDIAELYRERFGLGASTRNIHARLGYMGFILFDRGTFGVSKHLGLSGDEINDFIKESENLVSSQEANRQWHASEILSNLRKKMECRNLTKYSLGYILKSSNLLKDVGRLSFKLKSASDDDNDRLQIRTTIYNVLRQAGRPLTYDELKVLVSEQRGLGDHFLPIANELFSKIDSRTWGLLERDFTVNLLEQIEIKDKFYDFFIKNGQSLHKFEFLQTNLNLNLPDELTDNQVLGILVADPRFKSWHGGFVGLSSWDNSGRKTLTAVLQEIVESVDNTIGTDEIISRVSNELGYDFDRNRISVYLNKFGMVYDRNSSLWKKTYTTIPGNSMSSLPVSFL